MAGPRLPGRPRLPHPVVRAFRLLGLPVAEIARYWAQEAGALRRGLLALVVAAIADLAAGIVLGGYESTLADLPGLRILIPAAIAMRGATFGAFGARMGTAIHTGQFRSDLTPDSYLWRQTEAVAVLTLVTSLEAAALALLFGRAIGLTTLPFWDLAGISILGGVLASLILLVVTVWLARTASTRGWNMDDVGAPTITATGDLVAVPALLVASVIAREGAVTVAVGLALTVLTLAAVVYGLLHPRPEIRRLVRESVVVLTFAAAVSVLAGIVLESRADVIDGAFLILFPPFIAMFGSLGGVLSSRLTSQLHLGVLEPRVVPGRVAALNFSMTYLFAVIIYVLIGVAAWGAAVVLGIPTPGAPTMAAISLVGGLLGTTVLAAVAYTASTATYRFGLDPDNHAIPIVTSVMDFLGMLCLVAAMALFGVG